MASSPWPPKLDRNTISPKAWQRAYGRYVAGTKAVLDSLEAPVGRTPADTVWTLNKATLYHYVPTCPPEERHPIPLLLVYALINKAFIFDLGPGRSFVEYMVGEGFDVYLLDWGAPGPEDSDTTFDDYVTHYLTRAVRKVLRLSGAPGLSMLGYCLGANLAVVLAAAYPEVPLRNLILLTAPLDFTERDGSMAIWLDESRLDVDRLLDLYPNIPGEMIRTWAKLLKPVENFVGSYVNLWKYLDDEAVVAAWQAINRWVEDVIPFAGAAFRQFVIDYVRRNELIRGVHQVDGRPVDVRNIRAPVLNMIAEFDHLVARSQAETIMDHISSTDKELRVVPSSHVGMMASVSARYKLWPGIAAWLAPRSGHE